jgi:hypothetical protein
VIILEKIYLKKEDKEFILSEGLRYYLMNKYNLIPIKQEEVLALIIIDYKSLLELEKKK